MSSSSFPHRPCFHSFATGSPDAPPPITLALHTPLTRSRSPFALLPSWPRADVSPPLVLHPVSPAASVVHHIKPLKQGSPDLTSPPLALPPCPSAADIFFDRPRASCWVKGHFLPASLYSLCWVPDLHPPSLPDVAYTESVTATNRHFCLGYCALLHSKQIFYPHTGLQPRESIPSP